MRKAPRTGPGPLCRAAAGVGKFGGSRRKGSPAARAQRCHSGGRIRPQLPGDVSAALAPGTGRRAVSVAWHWGQCRMVLRGRRGFLAELGPLGAAGRELRECKGAEEGVTLHPLGPPRTPWGHGAVPKANVPRAWQCRAGTGVQEQRPRGHLGPRSPFPTGKQREEAARARGTCGLKGLPSQPRAALTDFSDSRAISSSSYNCITEFLCKLLSFIN